MPFYSCSFFGLDFRWGRLKVFWEVLQFRSHSIFGKTKVYTMDWQPSAVFCFFLSLFAHRFPKLLSFFFSQGQRAKTRWALQCSLGLCSYQNVPCHCWVVKQIKSLFTLLICLPAVARGQYGILHTSYVSANLTFDTAGASIGFTLESRQSDRAGVGTGLMARERKQQNTTYYIKHMQKLEFSSVSLYFYCNVKQKLHISALK